MMVPLMAAKLGSNVLFCMPDRTNCILLVSAMLGGGRRRRQRCQHGAHSKSRQETGKLLEVLVRASTQTPIVWGSAAIKHDSCKDAKVACQLPIVCPTLPPRHPVARPKHATAALTRHAQRICTWSHRISNAAPSSAPPQAASALLGDAHEGSGGGHVTVDGEVCLSVAADGQGPSTPPVKLERPAPGNGSREHLLWCAAAAGALAAGQAAPAKPDDCGPGVGKVAAGPGTTPPAAGGIGNGVAADAELSRCVPEEADAAVGPPRAVPAPCCLSV
jgi:hypothetical protein